MKTFKFDWEEESISNFLDMYSEVMPNEYFAKKFGGDILNLQVFDFLIFLMQ